MTEVLAVTKEGRKVMFNNPISLSLIKSFDCPCASLRVKVLCEKEPPYLKEIHIRQDGKMIFRGFLDRQIFEKTEEGAFLKIEARAMGSLLTDNEAVPGAYYNISFGAGFQKYAGGFKVFETTLDKNARGYEVFIGKGKSRWEAILHFAKIILGVTPYVRFDNVITTGVVNRDFLIKEPIGLRKIYNPSKIISIVVLRDDLGAYRRVFRSPFERSKGITRSRYYNQPKEWENKTEHSAIEVFKKSLSGSEMTEITLEGVFDLEIGDTVIFKGTRLAIKEMSIKFFESGKRTRLICCPVEDF